MGAVFGLLLWCLNSFVALFLLRRCGVLVYVSGVRLRGFRGVREGVVEGLDDFTILVGRNGAGKSTVLDAVYLASAWLDSGDSVRRISKYDYVVRRRGGRGAWNTSREVLWYGMDTERDVTIGLALGDGGVEAEFVVRYDLGPIWLRIDGFKDSLSSFLSRKGITGKSLVRLEGSVARIVEYPSKRSMNVPRNSVMNWLRESMPGLVEALGNVLLIDGYLLSRPALVEEHSWTKVLARRLDKEVVRVLREEFEVEAEGLTYAPVGGSNVLMVQLRDTSVRIDDLGDGARLATLILLTVLASRPKLLLLEEPETKMHPRGLKVLTQAVLKIAKKQGTQVIATTHSLEFVKIGLRVAENLGINASIIHLDRSADGLLTARKLTRPDADLLADLGIDPRFLDVF